MVCLPCGLSFECLDLQLTVSLSGLWAFLSTYISPAMWISFRRHWLTRKSSIGDVAWLQSSTWMCHMLQIDETSADVRRRGTVTRHGTAEPSLTSSYASHSPADHLRYNDSTRSLVTFNNSRWNFHFTFLVATSWTDVECPTMFVA